MYNKQQLITLILVLATTIAYSEPESQKTGDTNAQSKPTEQKPKAKQQPPARSKTYNYESSEKIQADSAVAFPVDI